MRWSLKTLLFAALALGAYGLGVWTAKDVEPYLQPRPRRESARPGQFSPSGTGRIQPKDGILSIGGIPGDRIKVLYVEVNDPVKPGQPLVEFASHDERKRELELATLQLTEARRRRLAIDRAEEKKLAELSQRGVMAGHATKLKLRLEEMQVPVAEQGLKYAADILQGLRNLDPARATVAVQEMQKAAVETASARARYEAAVASRDANRLQLELDRQSEAAAVEAVRAEFDLSRAALSLPVLEEQVKLAQLRFDRTLIKADSAGRVLRVLGRQGGTVGQEPILQLTTSDELVVIAEVYVDAINTLNGWLSTGQGVKATMTSPALGHDLHGAVRSAKAVYPTVARNALAGFSPRADADRRVIEVPIDLDRESSRTAAKFIGLEVDVKFHDPAGDGAR